MRKILVIDDEKPILDFLVRALDAPDLEVKACQDSAAAVALLSEFRPELVITDLGLTKLDCVALLHRVKSADPDVQVLIVTGADPGDAEPVFGKGPCDFLRKPFQLREFYSAVQKSLERFDIIKENRRLANELKESDALGLEKGKSSLYRDLVQRAERAALEDGPVLIQGEPGTGKKTLARFIHSRSPRSAGPLVLVDCSAMPAAQQEDALFGSGAALDPAGFREGAALERARGGALLLEDVDRLCLPTQARLLQLLPGADARLIATSARNLENLFRQGLFTGELLGYLAPRRLDVPSLRVRPQDIYSLLSRFIGKHARKAGREGLAISPAAMRRLERYPWPGNIRELEQVVESAVILCEGNQIREGDLPEELTETERQGLQIDLTEPHSLESIEMEIIRETLSRNHGNKARTAGELGLSLRTLYRKLDRSGGGEMRNDRKG